MVWRTALALVLASTIARGAPPPSTKDVLAHAAAYVADFEQRLSGIVVEERYEQVVTFPARRPLVEPMRRRLESDLLLVRPIHADAWFQFRDVFAVDGEPVRDRSDRLVKLFMDPTATTDSQIRGILADSARYNIGSLVRTINTPVLPLQFLETGNQRRFSFKRAADRAPAAMTREEPAPPGRFTVTTEVWVVAFSETRRGTMVRTTAGRDLPARGRFWIEPETGRVVMTELILENAFVRGVIDVNYQSEPLVGFVPVEMRERYDRMRDKSVIDGFATYGRFRQFQVKVDEKFAPIRK